MNPGKSVACYFDKTGSCYKGAECVIIIAPKPSSKMRGSLLCPLILSLQLKIPSYEQSTFDENFPYGIDKRFVAIAGGGTIGFAKYNPDFREWLNDKVPYTDDFLKFLFQEECSYFESFVALLNKLRENVSSLVLSSPKKGKDVSLEPKKYTPPAPAFIPLAEAGKEETNYTEIRLEKKDGDVRSVTIKGEERPKQIILEETHPKKILEIEKNLGETAAATVLAYDAALCALKNYNNDVQFIVENSVDTLDTKIWNSLRKKTQDKEATLNIAEQLVKDTECYIRQLEDILADTRVCATDVIKQQAHLNIEHVREDLAKAKKELDDYRKQTNLTDKYWNKVEEARNHFIDEIEILFPGINIQDKRLNLQGGELDLFILHAFSNVLFYQKELYKLQILEQKKVKQALENARKGNKELLTDTQIEQLVEQEKKCLQQEFQKKCLALRVDSERELRRQLKLQSEAFVDHLNDALVSKEEEMKRNFARCLDEKVTAEKCKFKLQMSALAGRVRGMDKVFKARQESDKIMKQSQVLWCACQNLYKALKAGCPGLPWSEQLRPLEPEISGIKNAAAENDELVKVILDSVPKLVVERGVYPEDALRERFLKVEEVSRHLALVPVGGARLPMHLLSYLHSLLLVKAASPIPQAELDDEAVDFQNLSTNEILQRARYWVDRGDFGQSLRYMNLLKGASRVAASEWMKEVRVLLETQQATDILLAHAAASGLVYL
ncbi:hypothetical protein FQA39_LY04598 [Lamprigera yunnana]|nr:hypothetical protein FQA39_LY04598 [Lamprigera yunnana]